MHFVFCLVSEITTFHFLVLFSVPAGGTDRKRRYPIQTQPNLLNELVSKS